MCDYPTLYYRSFGCDMCLAGGGKNDSGYIRLFFFVHIFDNPKERAYEVRM